MKSRARQAQEEARQAASATGDDTAVGCIKQALAAPRLTLEDAEALARVLMAMGEEVCTMLTRARQLLAEAIEREEETNARCPECGQRAARKTPKHWTPPGGSAPEWAHADGDPLCRPADGGPPAREPVYGSLLDGRF